MSLKNKTISNLFWSFLEKFSSRGIGFVTTILLARLLTPEDFGLVAMLTVFISVSESLSNGGFNHALIQNKNTDQQDYSVVFYINLIASVLLYTLLFLVAGSIATFYQQPLLTDLTRVLSLTFVINAFCYIQQTILTKEGQFKSLLIVHIPANFISAIVAIIMAYRGYGVWSIVAQTLTQRAILAIQLWCQSKWRPSFHIEFKRAKPLFSFGGKIMLSRIIDRIYDNVYLVIIGKFYSASTLGFYQNSFKLVNTPSDTFSIIIRNVTFPAFSSIQDHTTKLKIGLKKSNQQFTFILLPIFGLSAILAIPLFRFLLTEVWLPSVPYFRLLISIGILLPLSQFSLDMLKVKGKGNLFLKLNLLSKLIMIVGLIFLLYYKYNIWWLISWQVIALLIQYFLNAFYCGKILTYNLLDQIRDIFPNVLITVFTCLMILIVDEYIVNDWSDFLRLIIGFTLGLSLYIFTSFLFKTESFNDIKSLIPKLKK